METHAKQQMSVPIHIHDSIVIVASISGTILS